jgi:histone deacetylase 6
MDITEEDTPMSGVEPTILQSSETNGIASAASRPALGLAAVRRITDLEDSGSEEGPARVSGLSLPLSHQNGRSSDTSSLTSVSSGPLSAPSKFVGVVIPKPASMALPHASSRTGVVYDARMRFHTERDTEEEEDIHPEDPRRIYEIFKALEEANLLENEKETTDPASIPFKLWRIAARFAEPAEIALVHSQDHYRFMETLTG